MSILQRNLVRVLLGALLVGALATLAINQNFITRLRAERQAVSSEEPRLTGENQDINGLREANAEVEKLREENKDLPRLRNEARQLRRQVEELEKLRADNARLRTTLNNVNPAGAPALPPDFLAKSALGDAGLATPEAAAQTFFYAMSRGDIRRLRQCSVHSTPDELSAEDEKRQSKELQEQTAGFPGFRIADKKIISPEEVELSVQSSVNGASLPMKLKLIGNEWKMDDSP